MMKIYDNYRFTGTRPFSPIFQARTETLKCSKFDFFCPSFQVVGRTELNDYIAK